MLGVTSDLDEDCTVLAKDLSDSNLKCLVALTLKKAEDKPVSAWLVGVPGDLLGNENTAGGRVMSLSIFGLNGDDLRSSGPCSLRSVLTNDDTTHALSATQSLVSSRR